MDIEHKLISKIVHSGDLATPVERGIGRDWFSSTSHQRIFAAITSYAAEYGAPPTAEALGADHPSYRLDPAPEPMSDLIDRMRARRTSTLLEEGMGSAVALWERGDLDRSVAELSATVARIGADVPTGRDVDLTQTGDDRFARYLSYKALPGGMRGVPTGFTVIDKATLGLQPEQLVTLTGLAKGGKSFAVISMARAAHMYGKKLLLVSFEMTATEQAERLDSFRAGVEPQRLRAGQLSPAEWGRLEKSIKDMAAMSPFVMTEDITGMLTVTGVAAKLAAVAPDILMIDGVYLMTDEISGEQNTPTALTNLTRSFKRLAQRTKIPIVISTQSLAWKREKGKGLTAAAIGYSSSFLQDSDVVLIIEDTDEQDIKKIKIGASRNTPNAEGFIRLDWSTGSYQELEGNPFEASNPYAGGTAAW
jgi:replicative DNA helicase